MGDVACAEFERDVYFDPIIVYDFPLPVAPYLLVFNNISVLVFKNYQGVGVKEYISAYDQEKSDTFF